MKKCFTAIVCVSFLSCQMVVNNKKVSDDISSVMTPRMVANNIEMASERGDSSAQTIVHDAYVSYYSNNWVQPYWVAYELTSDEASADVASRSGHRFYAEEQIVTAPEDWESYMKYGYSKGHLIPCMDVRWGEEAMNSSFSYANCCPQDSSLNNGIWKHLEVRVNRLAKKYGKIYVCAGPIVPEGAKVIGDVSNIAVPSHFFKALCYESGGNWHSVGFLFPNAYCEGGLFNYAMTIDSLECVTGYDFFYNLPDDVENETEATFDRKSWYY